MGSLAALARHGGDHHAPPQVQSVDCLFSWSRGGSIQLASPAKSHAKSPPKTLLAGPIAVKKKIALVHARMRTEVVCPPANARPRLAISGTIVNRKRNKNNWIGTLIVSVHKKKEFSLRPAKGR
jgi:hypothetical protein